MATLKELEHLGNDSVQVIHNSVKHVIADLTEQLARLVLYGIESDQLLGYPKQGGSPSDSTGSKDTLSLEIQEKQVQRVLGDPGNPVMKLLDLDYRDTLKTADAKAYAQLNLLKVGRFLEIILISWNAVLSKSKYAAEWKLLYTQVTATPGSYGIPLTLFGASRGKFDPQ